MSTDELPTARRASVMFVYDHSLMLWGGMTQVIMGEGDGRFIVDIDIPGTYMVYFKKQSDGQRQISWPYYMYQTMVI